MILFISVGKPSIGLGDNWSGAGGAFLFAVFGLVQVLVLGLGKVGVFWGSVGDWAGLLRSEAASILRTPPAGSTELGPLSA